MQASQIVPPNWPEIEGYSDWHTLWIDAAQIKQLRALRKDRGMKIKGYALYNWDLNERARIVSGCGGRICS